MLSLLPLLALAQPVADVPPGATAVTVLVCPDAARCEEAMATYGAHATRLGLPVLPFDRVAGAALADADALDRYHAALAADDAPAAWAAMADLDHTVSPDELLAVLFGLAAARLDDGDPGGAVEALAKAASASDRRVHDLPPVPDVLLGAYLDAVAALGPDGLVRIDVADAIVFVDGVEVGPAPRTVAVAPGWHRISLERVGRHTAWVGEVDVRSDATAALRPRLDDDDRGPGLRAAVLGAMNDVPAPAVATTRLAEWARAHGLRHVRFVAPTRREVPDERVGELGFASVTLDAHRARLTRRGPGPAALRVAADRERFRLGAGVGWLRLGPREHATVDLVVTVRATSLLSAEARVGVAHSGTPYNLYPTWIDHQVYPIALGARLGRAGPGPYAAGSALLVVPYAAGAQAAVGYDLAPGPAQRLSVEARAGVTDAGALLGIGLVAVGRR